MRLASTHDALDPSGVEVNKCMDRHNAPTVQPLPAGFAVPPPGNLQMESLAKAPMLERVIASVAELGEVAVAESPSAAARAVGFGVLAVRVEADPGPLLRRRVTGGPLLLLLLLLMLRRRRRRPNPNRDDRLRRLLRMRRRFRLERGRLHRDGGRRREGWGRGGHRRPRRGRLRRRRHGPRNPKPGRDESPRGARRRDRKSVV